jgi:protease I
MANELNGKRIAFIATDGVEQAELSQPWEAARNAGAATELISIKPGEIQGVVGMNKGQTFRVDRTIDAVSPDQYDGLVLPGGVANPDKLRMDRRVVDFVERFFESGKPVASICHGPWLLVEADVVEGRTLASWPSLRTDIENAGGTWVDREVVVEQGLVTSRRPDDLAAFCREMLEEFAEGVHDRSELPQQPPRRSETSMQQPVGSGAGRG